MGTEGWVHGGPLLEAGATVVTDGPTHHLAFQVRRAGPWLGEGPQVTWPQGATPVHQLDEDVEPMPPTEPARGLVCPHCRTLHGPPGATERPWLGGSSHPFAMDAGKANSPV